MAFLDFLNQGIGGTTPAVTQPGMMGEGNITTQPAKPIGPTYGDITKAALQYGSSPGSSSPKLATTIPGSGWQQNMMQPLSPNAPSAAKASMGQGGEGDNSDTLAMISKFFAQLLGGV